ncbi:MAG: insulinase family protein, partial [Thermoanaerobaculia bacterium]
MSRTTMLKSLAPVVLGLVLPALAVAQATRPEEIEYPTLPEFSIPTPTVEELDNGMTVVLLEDRELPLVRMTALLHAGSRYEPAAKVSLAG